MLTSAHLIWNSHQLVGRYLPFTRMSVGMSNLPRSNSNEPDSRSRDERRESSTWPCSVGKGMPFPSLDEGRIREGSHTREMCKTLSYSNMAAF